MASVFTTTYIQTQIDSIKTIIEAYQVAILALATGTVDRYTINTGQTTQSVTKRDLSRMRLELNGLMSDLQTWDDMLNGTGLYVRGGC